MSKSRIWRATVRINYFDKNKSILLRNCAYPIMKDFAEVNALNAYVKPGWQGGPHMNLVFWTNNAGFDPKVLDLTDVTSEIKSWLQQNPSQTDLTEDQIARITQSMVNATGEINIPKQLQQNNTVQWNIEQNIKVSHIEDLQEQLASETISVFINILKQSEDRLSYWCQLARLMGIVGHFGVCQHSCHPLLKF